jgi:uncharacterized membrane protein YdjX (TVP38/TMEM64 family)
VEPAPPESTPSDANGATWPRRWWLLARVALIALALIGTAFGVRWSVEALGGPGALRGRFGWYAPIVSAALHAPIAASPLPSEPFALSHGPLYGFWLGALVGWAGWFAGSAIEYAVLRRIRSTTLRGLTLARPRWAVRVPVQHPAFLIGVRQVPGGFDVVNVAAALAGVPLARFLWCSAIAQIPTALLVSAAGLGLIAL